MQNQKNNLGTAERFRDNRGVSVPGGGSCLQNQPSKPLVNEPKYSVKEACEKMRIGETTLRSIIKGGGIAVLNIGGKFLLLECDIEKYLKGNYVTLKETNEEPNRLPPLPDNIANSDLIRKAG